MMERSAFRFVMVVIIFVLLSPKASIAGGSLATSQGRPVEWGASLPQGDEGVLARLFAFLQGVFGDQVDEVGADGPREKDSENRMGIDPNGNS